MLIKMLRLPNPNVPQFSEGLQPEGDQPESSRAGEKGNCCGGTRPLSRDGDGKINEMPPRLPQTSFMICKCGFKGLFFPALKKLKKKTKNHTQNHWEAGSEGGICQQSPGRAGMEEGTQHHPGSRERFHLTFPARLDGVAIPKLRPQNCTPTSIRCAPQRWKQDWTPPHPRRAPAVPGRAPRRGRRARYRSEPPEPAVMRVPRNRPDLHM